jgi:hypothetical protein
MNAAIATDVAVNERERRRPAACGTLGLKVETIGQ